MNLGNKFSFDNSESVNSQVGKKNTLKGQGKQKQTQPISNPNSTACISVHKQNDTLSFYFSDSVFDYYVLEIEFQFSQLPSVSRACLFALVTKCLDFFFFKQCSPIFQKCMYSLWESETYKTKYPKSFIIEAFSNLMHHSLSQ